MQKKLVSVLSVVVLIASVGVFSPSAFGATAVTGKLIALDAGHGGTESGAINTLFGVSEKNVNIDVVKALKTKLEADGAIVVLTREGDETLPSRRERVDLAISKCTQIAGRKCDVLVSVHHNGSSDATHNGTLVIYNEKKDIPLATALHDSLVVQLGLKDERYLHGGYGMTVYGNMISALTESYYITNNDSAAAWLAGTLTPTEVAGLYAGLVNYFTVTTPSRR